MTDAFKLDRERKLVAQEYLNPPEGMPDNQLVIWNQVVKAMPAGFFVEPDRFLLMAFIKCNLLIVECQEMLDQQGHVIISPMGKSQMNPWLTIQNTQNLLLLRLCEKLRITTSLRVEASGGLLKKELMKNNIKAEDDEDPRNGLI